MSTKLSDKLTASVRGAKQEQTTAESTAKVTPPAPRKKEPKVAAMQEARAFATASGFSSGRVWPD